MPPIIGISFGRKTEVELANYPKGLFPGHVRSKFSSRFQNNNYLHTNLCSTNLELLSKIVTFVPEAKKYGKSNRLANQLRHICDFCIECKPETLLNLFSSANE